MSIVRMLRATLIGRTADAEGALTAVQAAGLLHVTPMRPPAEIVATVAGSGDVLAEVDALRRARTAILAVSAQSPAPGPQSLGEVTTLAGELLERRESLLVETAAAEATLQALEPWGEFDPADLDHLAEHGAPITFARLTWNDWNMLDLSAYPHEVLRQSELEVHAIFVGTPPSELPVVALRLPRVRLSAAREELAALTLQLRDCDEQLGALAHHVAAIDARLLELADRAEVLRTIGSGLDEGELFAVQGYVPAENQVDLQRAVEPFGAVLLIDDPAPGEQVPVKLHQPGLIAGFGEVVRAFSGISYWEKDFTPAVLLLFLVYGSLCLLDGGYGVLLAITGFWLMARGSKGFGSVFAITGVFSTLVGMIGGQYFGLIVGKDFATGHHPPTTLASDPMTSFIFSLLVGLAGMTLSYATAIWQRGWKTSATGSLLLAMAANTMVLANFGAEGLLKMAVKAPSPAMIAQFSDGVGMAGTGLLVGGVAAWLVFPDPTFGTKAHAANVAWQLYSGFTGLGQDVMSHMRLFGIALSGSIMAMVVNQIAGLFPLPVTVAFGVVGHFFVFILSLLSLYIHTNRLIFLEFGSKCFDGGQAWYEPLRRSSVPSGEAAA